MKSQESLYRQCSSAVDQLAESPPKQHGGVFTEIDVVSKASSSSWSPEDFQQALHDANAVCGTQYRGRKLCRYGPIKLADGTEDYARIAGKIVYADAENGPEYWETPNGNFPRLLLEDDQLTRQGRRAGTERNDAEPWGEQALARPRRVIRRRASSVKAAKTEKELRDLVENLAERVWVLEEELKKQRTSMKRALQAAST